MREVNSMELTLLPGEPKSLYRLASAISKIMYYPNPPSYDKSSAGDIRHSYADISKATEKLSFVPQYSLDTGLDETIEWYRCSNFYV